MTQAESLPRITLSSSPRSNSMQDTMTAHFTHAQAKKVVSTCTTAALSHGQGFLRERFTIRITLVARVIGRTTRIVKLGELVIVPSKKSRTARAPRSSASSQSASASSSLPPLASLSSRLTAGPNLERAKLSFLTPAPEEAPTAPSESPLSIPSQIEGKASSTEKKRREGQDDAISREQAILRSS